ncbi:Alpha/Beta hydrolase protein [Tuber brumale]|nr:Alpha/Beta hydrolase protein [Tuber brumale]
MKSLYTCQLFFPLLALGKFTPEDLLSAPRRGEAVPNRSGSLATFHLSSYSFDTHSSSSSWNLLNLGNGDTTILFSDPTVQEVVWLDDESLLYINGTNSDIKGGSELWIAKHSKPSEGYKAASLPASVCNLKTASPSDKTVNFVVSALTYPNGTIYNPESAPKKLDTGLTYESLFVRHWDVYDKPEKSSLFSGVLSLDGDRFKLEKEIKNLMAGADGTIETPIAPFGGADDFDVSPDGQTVAFVSKTPYLNPANYTQVLVYIVPFDGSSKPEPINLEGKDTGGDPLPEGAASSPKFSPDGGALAYLQMYINGYESDQNNVFIYKMDSSSITAFWKPWDRSPSGLLWSSDASTIYLTAESYGRVRIFEAHIDDDTPKEITAEGNIVALHLLPSGDFLISRDSLTSSIGYFVFNPSSKHFKTLLLPTEVDPQLADLSKITVEDFSFDGAETKVHGFIVKPSDFDSSKKTRLAFLIHGGPQGAWTDSWSTRWNPALFAEAGYIAVTVNPTGSTGYGQAFTDAIQNQWGGLPYIDLVKSMEYLENTEEYNYIDFDRAVALGASYGGYMVNYIQGMPLGKKFQALVCHDGSFAPQNIYSTDELYFPQREFNGTLWDDPENYSKWSPSAHIKNWGTPQFVIHNALDFRLPISEGLSVFHILQSLGIPSKFLTFPDENHWVLKPENSLVWHREVLEWINRWTEARANRGAAQTILKAQDKL